MQWWWQLAASFVGGLLGSGSLWAYLSYRQRSKELQVSVANAASALQRDLLNKLIELIAKSEEYADVRDGKVKVAIAPNKLNQLNAQIEILRSDVLSSEARLAVLEGRHPRQINVKYVRPSPPTWGAIE